MRPFLSFTFIAVLLSLSAALAQAPALGVAAGYVLFTTAGAITNTATSHITGNVGVSTGAITGFGNVNGVMHSGDLDAGACATAVLAAYQQLNNTVADYFIASPLGNGNTLTSGTYSISGNTILTDTLILNGLNQPDAVFIFKIQGTLSSTALAKVILINGAQACNVFWKTEGLTDLASGTSMKGTLIVNNAAINLSSGAALEGRALSTTGAITLNNVLAYTPKGCGSPVLTGPLAPNLGKATCYVLFTGNGPAANNGVTFATGDIGTNTGLTTGYQPLNVAGTIHPIPDASTDSCATDLLVAHTYLNILPADIELLYPAQFGNSLVLTPHVYLLNAATALTDTVFLNAEGNPDAVFVFQINGALSTSTYANVVLTNGAQAKNIFWKVEGAVSINDYSQFKGTIIANNGAVSLTTGVNLEGRALTTNGALSTMAITAVMPPGCSIPLPLEWLYFKGKNRAANVVLNWQIDAEQYPVSFSVEKSTDGKKFEQIGNLKSENQFQENGYSFTDVAAGRLSYYRIGLINQGDQTSYSPVLKMTAQVAAVTNRATLYPNPLIHSLVITQNSPTANYNSTFKVYNLLGALVLSRTLTEQISILDIALPSGFYTYTLYQANEPTQSGKLISRP